MWLYGQVPRDFANAKREQLRLEINRPWRSVGAPRNVVSPKKPHSGINVWLLTTQGYIAPYWATIRQINKLRGQARKGEKSTPVVLWRIYVGGVEVKSNGGQHKPEHEQEERPGSRRFVLGYYSVSTPSNANYRHPSPRSWRFLRNG
jgi:antirestriction protein ArdC